MDVFWIFLCHILFIILAFYDYNVVTNIIFIFVNGKHYCRYFEFVNFVFQSDCLLGLGPWL